MTEIIIALIIGFFIGGVFGFAVAALLSANDEPYEKIEVSKINEAGE